MGRISLPFTLWVRKERRKVMVRQLRLWDTTYRTPVSYRVSVNKLPIQRSRYLSDFPSHPFWLDCDAHAHDDSASGYPNIQYGGR